MNTKNMTAAILLAGGQSVRMGEDKALLRIGDRTILDHLLSLLEPAVEQIIVMRAKGQKTLDHWQGPKVTWATDSIHDQGPLYGISDAVKLLTPDIEDVLVLSCDLPYLNKTAIKLLLNPVKKEKDMACIETSGKINPVLGLYRRSAIERVHSLIEKGDKWAMALIKGQQIEKRTAPVDQPQLFHGVNTPEEYQKFRINL